MSKVPDRRIFLGWERAIVASVVEHLMRDKDAGPGKPVDLEGTLIVVPTRQAGRRLREALACWCDEQGTALLSAQTVTPAFFLRGSGRRPIGEVTPGMSKAIWAKLLLDIDLKQYLGLFPAGVLERDYAWGLHTGDMLERLRRTLADAGLKAGEIPAATKGELEEVERWIDIGRLEQAYLDELERLEYVDAVTEEIQRAGNPELPDGIEKIVVAGVPAPTPLMLKALQCLEKGDANMEVLVHAPSDRKDWFDDWGQPITEKWCKHEVDIPDFESCVRVAVNPEAQARLACESIAEASKDIGPNDIAIGVPDHSVAPFLKTFLQAHGLPAYDPAETAVSEHSLYRLLDAFCGLYSSRSYDSFARLLRHHEVLNFFVSGGMSTSNLLTSLDKFQNTHLPLSFNDIETRFPGGHYEGAGSGKRFAVLGEAIVIVQGWLKALDDGLEHGIRNLLKEAYGARELIGETPKEKELEEVADIVDDILRECTDAIEKLGLSTQESSSLFLRRLSDEGCTPEREGELIDLEGWLELPWNSAKLLLLTGMNEGSVPDSRLGDVFVPDRLRSLVGLPNDEMRFARDVYLLASMLASRQDSGKVVLVVGKYSAVGDPLKPSRLLFKCADSELLARTKHLLGGVEETQKNFAFQRSFKLDPAAPIEGPLQKVLPDHLSATQFSQYLSCPFRFYLSKILRMQELNDEQAGMEATDFGSMIHAVLEVIGRREELRSCSEVHVLKAALNEELDEWIYKRFGGEPPLTIKLSATSARQRLAQAAIVQADQVKQGWVILEKPEKRLETTIDGFRVSGQIDRIDKNIATGELRIVDYKSGSPNKPKTSHLTDRAGNHLPLAQFKISDGGKDKTYNWKDLQLPIYSHMVRDAYCPDKLVSAAYFNLPKSVMQTDVVTWSDLTEGFIEEALVCAGRIIAAIRKGDFWPASDKVVFEDFESLVTGTMAESIEGESFEAFLEKGTKT